MNSPKVSILIPVYNRKKYIAECIQSALEQTFSDFEIVIVDNASDDGTWEICQKYIARDGRIRIFRNETNIGPVRNWVRCAQEARGKYSKILFSDDLLEPDCVMRMIEALENPDVGLVFCAVRVGESKEKSVIAYSVKDRYLFNRREYLSLLISMRAPVSPGAIMLRTKDLIVNLHINFPTATPCQFDRHGSGSDVMISLLTASSYPCVRCISVPLVFFRAHPGSFTASDANYEITNSLTSAMSFYLRYNERWCTWINYLAYTWVYDVWRRRCWISPRLYLRTNEGHGSLLEILFISVLIPCYTVRVVVERISSRYFGPHRAV